jgi:hypothetical protein
VSRRPALVTQADVARVLRAIEQVHSDREVQIDPDGTIRIVPGRNKPLPVLPRPVDEDDPIEF